MQGRPITRPKVVETLVQDVRLATLNKNDRAAPAPAIDGKAIDHPVSRIFEEYRAELVRRIGRLKHA